MIGLGILLLVLGAFAAYNVQEQQRTSSEIVLHQAQAMLAIHELDIVMREIRYQVVEFLRTGDATHLYSVSALHEPADRLLDNVKRLAREGREHQRIDTVVSGYRAFFQEFQTLMTDLSILSPPTKGDGSNAAIGVIVASPLETAALSRMSEEVLTNRVLVPLEESLVDNRQSVAETNRASQATAQHLKIGFMLLGICGAVAGLLLGTVIARAISRSIVQLNVTVRSVAGRLSDVTGPVTFSHTGDLAEIDTGLRELEHDIEDVVERLQSRETELLRSEQLAKVGQLAAGMAHELRNPLTPMKILVQAALERNDGVGLNGRSLQVINEEIGRLEQSIQAFLDYARPPLPDKAIADLREIVTGTAELVLGRAQQQRVEVQIQLPEHEVLAEVDRGQIRQLLLNLFLNAIDALPTGGTIRCFMHVPVSSFHQDTLTAEAGVETVSHSDFFNEHDALRVLTAAPTRARHRVKKWVTIHVADDGPGIPPESLASVFEPFVTTKETGTGLGLSICRRIAAAHDGELSARNLALGGAEFTLKLPRLS
jgi:two-component system, NtrC family, sensor histidine kinase HydH